jgi:ribosomal protein S18 acetylase RimI-like enzyme
MVRSTPTSLFSTEAQLKLAIDYAMKPSEFVGTPTRNDLAETRSWLEEEKLNEGQSFICNWSVIQSSFDSNMAFCLRINSEVVAFVIWQDGVGGRVVELLVAAVKPDFRRQGYGGELVGRALGSLRDRGVMAAVVEFYPLQSEGFWRRQGFMDFPSKNYTTYGTKGVWLFRPLANCEQPMLPCSSFVRMELWHKNIHDVQEGEVASTEINLQANRNDELESELAVPAMPDWKVRLTFQNGKEKVGKVKYIFAPSCFEDGFIAGVPQLA